MDERMGNNLDACSLSQMHGEILVLRQLRIRISLRFEDEVSPEADDGQTVTSFMLMKVQRNLLDELDNPTSYMYRSDIERTVQQTKEYIKSYQGMAFAYSEVLRSVRIKIENLFELQKLTMDNSKQ